MGSGMGNGMGGAWHSPRPCFCLPACKSATEQDSCCGDGRGCLSSALRLLLLSNFCPFDVGCLQVAAEQPKAAGSSLLAALTHRLAADALETAGLAEVGQALVLPLATGMALTTTLLALRGVRPPTARWVWGWRAKRELQGSWWGCTSVCTVRAGAAVASWGKWPAALCTSGLSLISLASPASLSLLHLPRRYVLWPRIDQKTCLKCIQAAGFEPVVVPLRQQGDQLGTDMEARRPLAWFG